MNSESREAYETDHARETQKERELREAEWHKRGLCDLCGRRHEPDFHD